jgi:sulfonate transport system ATP-binding protein
MHQRVSLNLNVVSKKFPSKGGEAFTALENVRLDVSQGEFLAIVGSSGCGKSTLLRLILGLETDYEGEILLDGKKIVGPGLDRGIVFQEHRLFPWLTVRDNVALGLENSGLPREEREALIRDHIELVGLGGFEKSYPHELSGGMSQRAAIARALVNRPGILLLDEPFGALDALTRTYLQNELQRIWKLEGATMIEVTHDVEEAVFLASRIVVMESRPGRIKKVIPVDLPYPRHRASVEFARIKEAVLEQIEVFGNLH